jgi:hypothetical protein
MLTVVVLKHQVGLQMSELAVGSKERNQAKVGVHLSRVVVVALLRSVLVGRSGSPAKHSIGFPEGQASADQ